MIEAALVSFVLGFVAFFATGIDDTLTYAGGYVHNGKTTTKHLITIGIFIGTFIALGIAMFAGELMHAIPGKQLIGGGALILFGAYVAIGKEYLGQKTKKHILPQATPHGPLQYVFLGVTLFFATGLDDIISYSNLMISNGAWEFIALGVIIATIASVLMANFLSKKLKKLKHPERIGGSVICLMGILIASGVL